MKSKTTREFRSAFARLPQHIQAHARDAFRLFLLDPQHPSLRFKRIHSTEPIFSARITLDYRALGLRRGNSSSGIGSAATKTTINSCQSESLPRIESGASLTTQ